VLATVKVRPGEVRVCATASATADLDGVCARRRTERQVGAKNGFRIEQRNGPKAILVPTFRDHDT
jgi:hypothetical protein